MDAPAVNWPRRKQGKIRVGVSACNAGARGGSLRLLWRESPPAGFIGPHSRTAGLASRREAAVIGSDLAHMPTRVSRELIESWRSRTPSLLRGPSTFRRITDVMQKHYAHYRKHIPSLGEKPDAPSADLSKRAVPEGFTFGGTPVIFREQR